MTRPNSFPMTILIGIKFKAPTIRFVSAGLWRKGQEGIGRLKG